MKNCKAIRKLGMVCTLPLLFSACSTIQPERSFPQPELVVDFSSDTTSFNNSYFLNQTLNASNKGHKEIPCFVFVASGNSIADYNLAVARMYSIITKVDNPANFKLLVNPVERDEQRSRLAIYRVDDWDLFTKNYMQKSDLTIVEGAPGIFRSSDKRLFVARPTKQVFYPSGSNPFNQLNDVLQQLGWRLSLIPNEVLGKRIGQLEVVTIDSVASSSEISLLLDDLSKTIFDGYLYEISAELKTVKLIKKSGVF